METVRPALDTLRELDEGRFLDRLALQIFAATNAVRDYSKAAAVRIDLKFAPLTKQNLSEPVITVEAVITNKLPKPENAKAIFYIDADGNPTTTQQRQRSMNLEIAAPQRNKDVA